MEKQIKSYFERTNPLKLDYPKVLKLSRIGRGESNLNFFLATKKENYLVRVDIINNIKRFKQEYLILKKLEPLKIAPRVFFIDTSKKYFHENIMFTSFISGKSLDRLKKEEYMKYYPNLAKKLAKLHEKRLNFSNSIYSFEKRLEKTMKIIKKLKRDLKFIKEKEKISLLIDTYTKELKKRMKNYQQKLSFCHGDLCLGNVMLHKKEFYLIDWEVAGDLDPAFELSYHLYEFPYTRKQRDGFLQEYLKNKEDTTLLKRMKFTNFFVAFSGYLEILHTCFNIYNKKGHKEFLLSADLKEYWDWGDYYLKFVIEQGSFDKDFEKKLKKELNGIYKQLI